MCKQRLRVALGVFIILSWLLAACAPTPIVAPAAQPASEAQADPTATQPAATAVPKAITLSVATNRIGTQAKLLEEMARRFEQENPGIKIDFSAPGQEYEHLMKLKMAAKDMPDVFATHGWAKVRYGEFLLDLRDQPWAASIDPTIKPAVVDDAGKVYVLPMDQEKTGPVYNVDVLQEYGVAVPKTWGEFLAACETIKTKSGGKVAPLHMGGADSWPVGQYYDFFSTAVAVSPQANDAQALLDGTYDWTKYVVLSQNLLDLKQKGYLNEDALTAKYSDSAKAFAEGKAAFGFYGAFLCEEAIKINPDCHCGLMPVPALVAGDAPALVGGEMTTWGVWKDSKNIEAAKKLVAFFAQPENIAAVANSNRLPAGLTGVEIDAGYLTAYYEEYADLRVFPYFDRVYLPNGMWDVLCRAGQDVMAGGATPEQVTETIGKEYERLRTAN